MKTDYELIEQDDFYYDGNEDPGHRGSCRQVGHKVSLAHEQAQKPDIYHEFIG